MTTGTLVLGFIIHDALIVFAFAGLYIWWVLK